jgi:predicted small metal-binding protein
VARVFQCDAVFPGCSGEATGETEQEVMQQVAEHARAVHGVRQVDEQTAAKVRSLIKTR